MLLVTILAGCRTPGVTPPSFQPEEAKPFERALHSYIQGKLPDAERTLINHLEQHPDDRRAVLLLNTVRDQLGRKSDLVPERRRATAEPPFDLKQVLRTIEHRNPKLRQHVARILQARARLREDVHDYGPELGLITRFYPAGLLARLTQSILGALGTRDHAINRSRARLVEAVLSYHLARQDLLYQSIEQYVQLVHLRQEQALVDRQIDLLNQLRQRARFRRRYGGYGRKTMETYDERLRKRENERSSLQIKIDQARTKLNRAMSRPPQASLTLRNRKLDHGNRHPLPHAVQQAIKHRPEVSKIIARGRAEQAVMHKNDYRVFRADGVASYGVEEDDSEDLLSGFAVEGRFSIPLLVWPIMDARSDREQALHREYEARLEERMAQVRQEVVSRYHAVHSERKVLSNRRTTVHNLKQEAERTNTLFQFGAERNWKQRLQTRLDVLEARRELLEQTRSYQTSYLSFEKSIGMTPSQLQFAEASFAEPKQLDLLPYQNAYFRVRLSKWHERRRFVMDFLDVRRARGVLLDLFSPRSVLEHRKTYRSWLRDLRHRNMETIARVPLSVGHQHDLEHLQREIDSLFVFQHASSGNAGFQELLFDVQPRASQDQNQNRNEHMLRSLILLDGLLPWFKTEDTQVSVRFPSRFVLPSAQAFRLYVNVLKRAHRVVIPLRDLQTRNQLESLRRTVRASPVNVSFSVVPGSLRSSPRTPEQLPITTFRKGLRTIQNLFDDVSRYDGLMINNLSRLIDLILEKN